MNTRKYPRTLVEAFGPHTSRSLYVKPDPMHKNDIIVLAGSVIAGLVLVVLMVLL